MVHQLGCFCLHVVTYSFLNNNESYYLINICYIVYPKTNFNKFKKIEIILNVFLDQNKSQ